VKQLSAPLALWIVDAEGRLDGPPASPALTNAILSLAERVRHGNGQATEDVELAADESNGPRAVRLSARPGPGASVVVACLELDGFGDIEETLSRFEMAMRATHDAVWDWNIGSQKSWWNRQQFEMLGYDPTSMTPTYEAFASRIHPGDRARFDQHLDAVIASGANEWQDEYRFIRGEEVRVALDRGCIERGADGRPLRMVGVMSDITEQRNLEHQLAQSQRMESIGRLAGGIAHDFNNLLTVILSSVELVLRKAPDKNEAGADLAAIKDAAERAARLTSQLLSFARRRVVAPTRLDLNALTLQMDRLLRRVIGEHIELTTSLGPELGAIVADRGELEQVLVNLAINARDAMPKGGSLAIKTKNVTIGQADRERAGVQPGNYVMLAVSDTGVGISRDALPHIFEPFYTTKPTGQGTGLGLATCYGIVHQAGGHIRVETRPNQGTTFEILLPRVGECPERVEQRAQPRMRTGSETVLFVEDDPAVRRIGVQVLAEQNYRVLEAPGGPEALRVAKEHSGPIHLLVTDVVMPQMSGTELARELLELRPDLRVLYTSGYTEDDVVHHGGPKREIAFLQKPYLVETILGKVRDLLDFDA
jgi:signal transduction histidine kinase